MGCLYKLQSPSGKCYIGITAKTLDKRWAKHVEHALGKRDSGALYAALRKYGPDSFFRGVLVESDDWEKLCQLEKDAILIHESFSPGGYNLTTGGEGTVGPRSEKARLAVSIAQKKRFSRPEEIAKLVKIGLAASAKRWAGHVPAPPKKRSRVSREEHSRRTREGMHRPEVAAKCAAYHAIPKSAHTRAKISASKTGMKLPPCSEQRKRLISEARKREWQDPVIRERRL